MTAAAVFVAACAPRGVGLTGDRTGPVVPPAGSVVRLSFHSGRHAAAEAPPS